MHAADADPTLSPKGCGADHADGYKADHGQAIDRKQQGLQAQQRKPCQRKRHAHADKGCDPVVIPVRVVRLSLGAGNQQPCDGDHGEGNTPEDPVHTAAAAASFP